MGVIGVITGDIINSKEITVELRGELIVLIENIAKDFHQQVELLVEMYRGDSFQILSNPIDILRIAIVLKAKLRSRGWDARVAIGVGEANFMTDRIVLSDGEAFNNSGTEFDRLGKREFAIRTPWSEINDEMDVEVAFADNIISGWTKLQGEAMFLSLKNREITKKEIGLLLGKKPQNVSQTLILANEQLIWKFIGRYEQVIRRLTDNL